MQDLVSPVSSRWIAKTEARQGKADTAHGECMFSTFLHERAREREMEKERRRGGAMGVGETMQHVTVHEAVRLQGRSRAQKNPPKAQSAEANFSSYAGNGTEGKRPSNNKPWLGVRDIIGDR